jgi:hypothetical protein
VSLFVCGSRLLFDCVVLKSSFELRFECDDASERESVDCLMLVLRRRTFCHIIKALLCCTTMLVKRNKVIELTCCKVTVCL